jgi:hypothetical protein
MARRKDNDGKGFVWLKTNVSDNEKAPFLKGFVNITEEMLELLNEAEADENGNIKVQLAIWKKLDEDGDVVRGVFQGRAEVEEAEDKSSARISSKSKARGRRADKDF